MNPYTPDQQRAADYICEITNQTIGGGDDPVGFLIASHRVLAQRTMKIDAATVSLARQVISLHELNKDGISGKVERAEVRLAKAIINAIYGTDA